LTIILKGLWGIGSFGMRDIAATLRLVGLKNRRAIKVPFPPNLQIFQDFQSIADIL
jgi:hypothetical protein